MQEQINDLKIAMATQQTIENARWEQVTRLLEEIKSDQSKQRDDITSLKTQLAQGSGATKFVLLAGSLVALLVGLAKLLPTTTS